MRKVISAGIMAAGLGLVFGAAAVAATDEQTPEAKAYFSFGFGGEKPGVRALHYGLRLDHDRYFVPAEQPLPALMQLDFSRRGLSAMQVNGVNVLRPAYRANQDEEGAGEEEEVIEEEEGFFESIGNWFSGLFGDDEEEAEVAESDTADEAVADEGDGTFLSYDAVDWGLLAMGVAGIAFIGSEVADGDDDPDPKAGGGGTPPLPPCGPGAPAPPNCDLPGPLFTARTSATFSESNDHQQWLDSGTGQMGDLQARD
jgi:hypothetical protein